MRRGVVTGWSPLLVVGALTVATIGALGLLAPLIAPYDPHAVAGSSLAPPSLRHILGTNDIGQDVLSQLIYGARRSLGIAFAAASVGTITGVLVGAWAGLRGGPVDTVAMRTVDVALAMPGLPLLILVAALAGPSTVVVILAIAFFGWPPIARIVRSHVLSVKGHGYVACARGFGGGPAYLIRRHLAPATGPVIASQFVELTGVAIVVDAGLAFLGLVNASTTSWGSILNRASAYPGIYDSPAFAWWLLPPGLAITLLVLGLAFLGVGLEPFSNPRWDRFR